MNWKAIVLILLCSVLALTFGWFLHDMDDFAKGEIKEANRTDSLMKQNKILIETEDFNQFLEDFSTGKDFQLSRIIFPFKDCEFPGDNDSECDSVIKEKWQYLQLLDTSKFPIIITNIYDNFKLEMKNSGERVLSFEANGTSVCSLYYFKSINGKWFLIKRSICSDD